MLSFNVRLFQRSNGIWYIEAKRGVWRSLKTCDEVEARRTYKELMREAVKGKLLVLEKKSTITLKLFFSEYLAWAEKNRSITTTETITFAYAKLLPAIGDKALCNIVRRDLDHYIDFCRARKNSPVTINIGIRTLKAALSKAVEWGYLSSNPWKGYKQIKHHKRPAAFLEKSEDIAKLLAVVNGKPFHTLLLALLIYTGARRSEVCRLEWKDITDTHITFRTRKNYKDLQIPIMPSLGNILNHHRKDIGRVCPITPDQASHIVKTALRAIGRGDLRLHDLRHTFASQLILQGVPLSVVSRLLGHSHISTTMIYSHLTDQAVKDAIGKLPY